LRLQLESKLSKVLMQEYHPTLHYFIFWWQHIECDSYHGIESWKYWKEVNIEKEPSMSVMPQMGRKLHWTSGYD